MSRIVRLYIRNINQLNTIPDQGGSPPSSVVNDLALPYSYNPATAPDGSLPSIWRSGGNTWTISGGKIINTPTETELFTDPGLEGTYTAGRCNAFVASLTPSLTQSADVHAGAKAQQFTADAQSEQIYQTINGLTVGRYSKASVWAKRTTALGAGTARALFQVGLGNMTAAAYTRYAAVIHSTAVSKNFTAIKEEGTTNFDTYVIDDCHAADLLPKELITTVLAPTSDVKIAAAITKYSQTWAGVVARVDDPNNPRNYLIAYWSGITLYLESVVNGVSTVLTSGTPTYADGRVVEIWVQGTSAALYYNTAKIGATVTVPASTAKNHGIFQTDSGGAVGLVTLSAYPFDDYRSKPADALARIVWTSDIHRSRCPEFTEMPAWMNQLNADMYVDTGDVDVQYLLSAYQDYVTDVSTLTMTRHNVPGNHDNNGWPVPNDFGDYIATINEFRFAFTLGGVRFIGYHSRQDGAGNFYVPAEDIAYVENELATLGGLPAVIFSHMACPDAGLKAELVAAGIKAYLNGHAHYNCKTYLTDGYLGINGGSVDTTNEGAEQNTDGGFMILDIFADRIDVHYARARWGWDRFKATNSGIANDVRYTPITIPL